TSSTTLLSLLLLATAIVASCHRPGPNLVLLARAEIANAANWAQSSLSIFEQLRQDSNSRATSVALSDCVKLYGETELLLERLVSGDGGSVYSPEDAMVWLSGAMASHRTCLDGMEEKGLVFESGVAQNLTALLGRALALYGRRTKAWHGKKGEQEKAYYTSKNGGLLASWNAATSKADMVVARDGSGNYKSINEAVGALARMGRGRPERVIIYVKAGVYNERVEIGKKMKNVMMVGDGVDKTIITGDQNVVDGASTLSSATFGVSGDGFWARDMTFENTAGPHKHQAVAAQVSSDLSVFYRCSFRAYQDTLFVHSLRQFYRDCQIYGTIDFVFGDASAVLQNCDIFVRRPMDHQANMITAQGRDNPSEPTGIVILNSRVLPSSEFTAVEGQFRSYLGRPWRRYSRTVFLKTDLDGLIDPKGWREWSGGFALSTLFYGEYLNSGAGASTARRVRWPGFHVLSDYKEASPFSVRNFIQGEHWIPATGVPFWLDI
ncbi:Pectinesterase, partial [Bertholletia excelsa]